MTMMIIARQKEFSPVSCDSNRMSFTKDHVFGESEVFRHHQLKIVRSKDKKYPFTAFVMI